MLTIIGGLLITILVTAACGYVWEDIKERHPWIAREWRVVWQWPIRIIFDDEE